MLISWVYAILSGFLVSLIALIGIILTPINPKRLEKLLIYFVSFSAGALLGGAFFHLIPEVVEEIGFTFFVSSLILGGIVISFIVEKVIHWHYNLALYGKDHTHPFAIMSLVGGSFHNLLDGLIIGGSYLINIPTGIAITGAVALHKIPKEMGWFGILMQEGFSKTKALCFNYISSLTTIIGAVLALLAGNYIENIQFFIVPLAAGGIIYLAGSDLIPELHKEKRVIKSILQLVSLLAGIAVMALLLLVG
jgi:zinc and cadmium transporter|tara:strand:+ start:393 stop:1142 length:750 start_codon:yes stop_codon:yes gene_type:complete